MSVISSPNTNDLAQNREAVRAEKAKLKRLRKLSGIYPSISILNLFQLPLHMVYISLINKLSYNYNISPQMLTEGFFWFQDLSSPDPLCILPVLGGLINVLNMSLAIFDAPHAHHPSPSCHIPVHLRLAAC